MSPKHVPQVEDATTEPKRFSVYIGRELLGYYLYVCPGEFWAFAADDRPLGSFRKARHAVRAINPVADRS